MEFGLSGATGHPAVAPVVVGNSSGSEFVISLMGSLMERTARGMPMKNRLVIVINVQVCRNCPMAGLEILKILIRIWMMLNLF